MNLTFDTIDSHEHLLSMYAQPETSSGDSYFKQMSLPTQQYKLFERTPLPAPDTLGLADDDSFLIDSIDNQESEGITDFDQYEMDVMLGR